MDIVVRCKDILCHIAKNSQNIVFTGSADSEMSEEQKKEKLSELRKKEQEIQDILAKKTKELKKICLREAVRNHFVLHFIVSFSEQSRSVSCIITLCSCAAGRLMVSAVASSSSKPRCFVLSGAYWQAAKGVSPLFR